MLTVQLLGVTSFDVNEFFHIVYFIDSYLLHALNFHAHIADITKINGFYNFNTYYYSFKTYEFHHSFLMISYCFKTQLE